MNEESNTFAEAIDTIPPFWVDRQTLNKMNDLNDVRVQREYSTFIHQSENPEEVKECSSLNPLSIDAILKYGIEHADHQTKVVCAEDGKCIMLDNTSSKTRLNL